MQAVTLSTTSFGSVYWSDIQDAYIYKINRKFDVDDMPPPAMGRERQGKQSSGLLQRAACGSRFRAGVTGIKPAGYFAVR